MNIIWLIPVVYAWLTASLPANEVTTAFAREKSTRSLDCELLREDESKSGGADPIAFASLNEQKLSETDLRCHSNILHRTSNDAALLESLSANVSRRVAQAVNGTAATTWQVIVFHPTLRVREKIGFAAMTELLRQGQQVIEARAVQWAFIPSFSDLPQVCEHKIATTTPTQDPSRLYLFIANRRNADIAGGVCDNEGWRWLR